MGIKEKQLLNILRQISFKKKHGCTETLNLVYIFNSKLDDKRGAKNIDRTHRWSSLLWLDISVLADISGLDIRC